MFFGGEYPQILGRRLLGLDGRLIVRVASGSGQRLVDIRPVGTALWVTSKEEGVMPTVDSEKQDLICTRCRFVVDDQSVLIFKLQLTAG